MSAMEELAMSEGLTFARLVLRMAGISLECKALKRELAEVKARLEKLEAPDNAA